MAGKSTLTMAPGAQERARRAGYNDPLLVRFLAAFPWWNDARHFWEVEVTTGLDELRDGLGMPAQFLRNPALDAGAIRVDMPGESVERYEAVVAWLANEFGPVRFLPSPATATSSPALLDQARE